MKIRHIVMAAGGGLALVGAGTAAGAAIAAGPVSSSGVIHSCYATQSATNGSHAIRLQNVGRACPAGTTPLRWNQQGRTGATGGYRGNRDRLRPSLKGWTCESCCRAQMPTWP